MFNLEDLYIQLLKQRNITIDRYGRKINLNHRGRDYSDGIEIDHIWPTSKGGLDSFENKEVVHWKSNLEKGNETDFVAINGKFYTIEQIKPGIGVVKNSNN